MPSESASPFPVGKVSGAHINPIVTLAFVLRRRMRPWLAAGYVAAQLTGAIAGAAVLLAWGPAVIAGIWHGWRVYWAGPVLGALIGVALIRPLRQLEADIAKVYHFGQDHHGLLRWSGETDPSPLGWPRQPDHQHPIPDATVSTAATPGLPHQQRAAAGSRPPRATACQ